MITKIDIVSGFLGAGKTTFIRKLITEEYKDEKVVVLENEFGKVNIDGLVLKDRGVIVKEITAGCICCSLSGNLDDAINEIFQSFQPDRIIIEPTGIAMLSQVIGSCTSNEFSDLIKINMVITVVDVQRFKLSYSYSKEFLENQIKSTQSIILSKTEGIDNQVIQDVITKLHEINSEATVINLPWDKVSAAELISDAQYIPMEKTMDEKKPVKIIGGKHKRKIEACEIETEIQFNKQRIEDIFSELEKITEYGNIIRGKGLVLETGSLGLKFDYVSRELSFERFNLESFGKICIIGIDLNKDKIKDLFKYKKII